MGDSGTPNPKRAQLKPPGQKSKPLRRGQGENFYKNWGLRKALAPRPIYKPQGA